MKTEADKLREALDLYRQGDLTRAAMLLETIDFEVLDADLHAEANYLWGLVLARANDPLEAAHHFQLCVKLDPRFYPALDAWGNVLAGLGDSRGAIEKYKRALAVASPEQASHVLFNYGSVLLRAGYTLRALRKFRESFQRNHDNHDAAYMTGLCYLKLKRPRGALKWMRMAIDLAPDHARNHVGYGNAWLALHRYPSAEASYAEALRHDPHCADAHYNWATALAEQEDYVNAVRHCKLGLRANPDGFELLAHQAWCLRQLGAYDAALHAAQRMKQVINQAANTERKPEFRDLLAANEAATRRALGRNVQARNILLSHLREARDPSPHSLAELRFHDIRRLKTARCYELTLNVRPPRGYTGDESPTQPYHRTYWVIADSIKEARRMARELEPQEAELRFDPEIGKGPRLTDADRGVVERSAAITDE